MKHVVSSLIACAGFWFAGAAAAGELTLFNVELRTADEATLHNAAVAAGARLIKSSKGHRIYDASRIGLPGAQTLEVLFDEGRFVIAAYAFRHDPKANHELRRLLVAKYGDGKVALDDGRRLPVDMTQRFAECAPCKWDIEAPMELVYTDYAKNPRSTSFLDEWETRLSYVNRSLFTELQRRTAEAAKGSDRERARGLGSRF